MKKFGLCFILVFGILTWLLLAPLEDHSTQEIDHAKRMGEFLSENPRIIEVMKSSEPTQAVRVEHSPSDKPQLVKPLSDDEAHELDQVKSLWLAKDFVRNESFVTEIDQLFEIAERTRSVTVLDMLQSQIVASNFEARPYFSELSQNWMSRYLTLETRTEKRAQILELQRETH